MKKGQSEQILDLAIIITVVIAVFIIAVLFTRIETGNSSRQNDIIRGSKYSTSPEKYDIIIHQALEGDYHLDFRQ